MQPISEFDPALSVNELLRRHPAAASVLTAYGIDSCCGGGMALSDAADAEGVDLPALLAALAGVACEVPS